MLDFSLTDEQEEVRRLAHRLALDHLRPHAREAERSGDISPELWRVLAQTGLMTPFPESYGGSGALEASTYVLIAEELGFGDGGLALNVLSSLPGLLSVWLLGSEEQRLHYIVPFCQQSESCMHWSSLAFAEPGGSYMLRDVALTAHLHADGYLLNGSKRNVLWRGKNSLHVVLARLTDKDSPARICAFVLPEQAEGLQVVAEEQKLGMLAVPSVSLHLRDVKVPVVNLLGTPESIDVLRVAALSALFRAGIACGTARAALEYAGEYAVERVAFGRPIVSYQSIAFLLAEMAMKLDAVRLQLWYAASLWDAATDGTLLLREAEAAQTQAVKLAQSATIDAVQVLGGAGFMQDHPVEMWMRNAAAME